MGWLLLFLGFTVLRYTCIHAGNSRYYATESCSHVLGPDYGAYLEFDRGVRQDRKDGSVNVAKDLRGTVFECLIVMRGMPSTPDTKRYIATLFREFHVVDPKINILGNSVEECGRAYAVLYKGMDQSAAVNYTMCGPSVINSAYEWEGEYSALYFYADYRNPNYINTTAIPPWVTAEPDGTTPVDDFPYPELFFKVDFTSYDMECNDSVEGSHMMCNNSKRCLHDSLRCDFWYSKNCASDLFPKDISDVSKKPPGNCYRRTTPKTTTTTPAPPAPPPDFTPLYAILGTLAGLMLLLWCCCRPGYLPWRCARLRNCPCCNSCGNCWARCCPACAGPAGAAGAAGAVGGGGGVCCGGPGGGCCGGPGGGGGRPTGAAAWRAANDDRLLGNSPGSSPGYQAQPFSMIGGWKKPNSVSPTENIPNGGTSGQGYAPSSTTSNPDTDSTTLSNGWLNFLSGDGGHLREHR